MGPGWGPHGAVALGGHLARREITAILRELLTRVPAIRAAGEPDYLRVASLDVVVMPLGNSGSPRCCHPCHGCRAVQVARRRTSQTVAAMSSTDSASSQPPSIPWKGQNRLPGWYLVQYVYPCWVRYCSALRSVGSLYRWT